MRTYATKENDFENFIKQYRQKVFEEPAVDNEYAVVLFSGGMDSVISSHMLLERTKYRLAPLYIDRNARSRNAEIASAKRCVTQLSTRYPSRVLPLEIIESPYPSPDLKRNLDSTYKKLNGHPGRNMFLLLNAAYYLLNLRSKGLAARTIFIGSSPNDTFSHSQLFAIRAANCAICTDVDDWSIQITSPLLEPSLFGKVDKAQLVKFAQEHNIDVSETYTCTQGDEPCNECDECKLRNKYVELI